jgi:predicted DNA-binding transcriptional regulator YafY
MDRNQIGRIHQAMKSPDDYVVRLVYRDRSGTMTQRVVSPIRFLDGRNLLALCLCRESPRRFELERCSEVELLDASDVLMPVEIRTWTPAPSAPAIGSVGTLSAVAV